MYKKNIIKILVKTGIGFILAFLIMTQIEPDWGFQSWAIMALFLGTIPYGWSLINRFFGSIIIFDGALFAIGLLIKLILSFLIGWIAVPISLLWNIIMYIIEKKKVSSDINLTKQQYSTTQPKNRNRGNEYGEAGADHPRSKRPVR